MSLEKLRKEAARWLSQARADLRAAEVSRQAGCFEWACFQAQQCAEKILKAFWMHHGIDPWGHSVLKLMQDFPDPALRDSLLKPLQGHARLLDKLYIPTRYPNGLPDLTPSQVYGDTDAEQAIQATTGILKDLEAALLP
ncbi:MAG: HEPN domain-containing protein [Acidobacteria bacterium]|nr:HEPN domain-containing protein [Acidobacteriota bacterium]